MFLMSKVIYDQNLCKPYVMTDTVHPRKDAKIDEFVISSWKIKILGKKGEDLRDIFTSSKSKVVVVAEIQPH